MKEIDKAGLYLAEISGEDRIGMNIALRVLVGPLKDKVFLLEKPMSIGRAGDITLEDPTVSRIHALIEREADGSWTIRDNDTKNGIKVGAQKVTSAPLKPGIIFHIGEHSFEVFDPSRPAARAETVVISAPKITEAPAPPKKVEKEKEKEKEKAAAPKPEKKKKYWHETLVDFLKTHKDAFKDKSNPLVPLEPAVILEFVRGLQMNSKWVLGYGPRKLGPATVDLPIWEPGAPQICFELQPTPEGVLYKTEHTKVVLLNNQQVDSRLLRVGDTISIHDTMIEVDFTE